MVPSSCHAISQLVGHTCAWRRVQISVWKSEEAVKRCKSLNEACAGPVQLADTAADTRVADILMGIRQGHVLGNTLILLCASIALSTWNIYHNLAKCQTKDNLSRYFMFAVCFSFSVSWLFFQCLTNIILYNLISSAPDLMKVEVFWFVVGSWSHKKFKTKIEFPYLLTRVMKSGNVSHVSWLFGVYEWTYYYAFVHNPREFYKNCKNMLLGGLIFFIHTPRQRLSVQILNQIKYL